MHHKMNKEIIIYTSKYCSYCNKAKSLLKNKDVKFQEVDITDNQEIRLDVMQKSGGKKTVPQIFISGKHIGGFDDLKLLDDSGALNDMISWNEF